jgi:F-type H+-transporting ATPase subunit delta
MSLAKNYARAFFDECSSNGKTRDVVLERKNELLGFWSLLESSAPLKAALTAPVTSPKEKTAVVQELAGKLKLSKITVQFLSLLSQNGRVGILPQILDALDEVRLQVEGGVLGKIVSAEPLEASAVKEITEAFTQKLKKKVEFKVSSDPSLLAGLKVTVNGVTYDGTLLSQLERLKESFVQGTTTLH